ECENGVVNRWVATPPAPPRIVAPGPAGRRPELAPTHDLGADIRLLLGDHGAADVLLAAHQAAGFAPRLRRDHPLVKPFAAVAQRVVLGLVGAGNVAVQGGRDVRSYLAHA